MNFSDPWAILYCMCMSDKACFKEFDTLTQPSVISIIRLRCVLKSSSPDGFIIVTVFAQTSLAHLHRSKWQIHPLIRQGSCFHKPHWNYIIQCFAITLTRGIALNVPDKCFDILHKSYFNLTAAPGHLIKLFEIPLTQSTWRSLGKVYKRRERIQFGKTLTCKECV